MEGGREGALPASLPPSLALSFFPSLSCSALSFFPSLLLRMYMLSHAAHSTHHTPHTTHHTPHTTHHDTRHTTHETPHTTYTHVRSRAHTHNTDTGNTSTLKLRLVRRGGCGRQGARHISAQERGARALLRDAGRAAGEQHPHLCWPPLWSRQREPADRYLSYLYTPASTSATFTHEPLHARAA